MDTNRTDQRKHRIQMTRFEADAVTKFVQSVSKWNGLNSQHISSRKFKWEVTDAEILSAVKNGEVVEVHFNNAPEVRAVVRCDIGMRSVCVTVSLTSQSLVTLWVNLTDDKHSTLRLNEYKWGVNLVQVVAGLRTQTTTSASLSRTQV